MTSVYEIIGLGRVVYIVGVNFMRKRLLIQNCFDKLSASLSKRDHC